MERLGHLIEKLKQQHASGMDAQSLMLTVQMIQKELLLLKGSIKKKGRNGVSVVMPVQLDIRFSAPEITSDNKEEKLIFELSDEIEMPISSSAIYQIPTFIYQQEMQGISTTEKDLDEAFIPDEQLLDTPIEPILELTSTPQKEPIKDLKKAIDIDHRRLFIDHLFKGDETMYERSIKTINNFNVYSEAEFWIRRELTVKIGWKDEELLVRQFNQLVSRRFELI